MKDFDAKDPREKFRFLDEKTANEPHVFEVLNEILTYQMNSLPSGEQPFATLDILMKSSKIKIPFTSTRDRTIQYLVDILSKRYAHIIKTLVTFDFKVDESTKQIKVNEFTEYTILLNNKDYESLVDSRDKVSIVNLLELLKKYRFFNLSKLIKKSEEKSELSRVIKKELGRSIFTFKNYNIDDNKIEWAEDFCFHIDNYESVKDSLNLNNLKEIINSYSDSVKRGLNKFGILNFDFNDYRDSKLSYIFSVLMDDLSSTLTEKDMIDVKNMHSLVTCLTKVDTVVDPILIHNDDIIKFIREQKITSITEIIGNMPELDIEMLKKWSTPDNLKTNKIAVFPDNDGEIYYIDGNNFFNMVSEYNQIILFQPEKLGELPPVERRKVNTRMELLYKASLNLLKSGDRMQDFIYINNDKVQTLKKILDEYEKFKNKEKIKEDHFIVQKPGKRRSIFGIIIDFFKSLFKIPGKSSRDELEEYKKIRSQKKELSSETIKIFRKTIDRNAPVIALSDFVELTPDNDYLTDRIIKEFRDHNLKIVIPVYNARRNLYPKRSQKLLIPDIEYLLVSTEIVKSPTIIREFTDSLVGYKIKDEIMPASAVIAVEKYLMTLYRQHKALK
jgi:hypothetical protein